jgi:hypothetical protein
MILKARRGKAMERTWTVEDVLSKQHKRVLDNMAALVQNVGFIRAADRLPEEVAALEFAQAYLDRAAMPQRKPPGSCSHPRGEVLCMDCGFKGVAL